MRLRVDFEGLKGINEALEDLPKATSKNIARRVLKEEGKPIAEAARGFVEVDSGALRDSIAVSTKLVKSQRRKHKKESPDDIEVYVGPGADPAAHLQEFGSSKHPGKPFMRPAWDGARAGMLERMADRFWREIRKAADRLARKAARAAKKAGNG